MEVPFFTNKYQDARYGKMIREKIDLVIKKGNFILGEETRIFEENVKKYAGVKYALGVANGSDALYLALLALELPKDSEVITTPFTFFASTSCIIRNGLKPVFVDASRDYYNIDAEKIEEKINPNTSCILPVDLFSHCADMDKIKSIADRRDVKIVEDSAEAFGMKWNGAHSGTISDIGVLSFFPTKTLSCFGDGGMILTNNEKLYEKLKILRVHGASQKYRHKYCGINSRLDELQAAILNVKLKFVDDEVKERESLAKRYFENLKDIKQIKLPSVKKEASPVWYVFSIICEERDNLEAYLKEKGIGASIYYPLPMHLQECFRYLGYKEGDFPIAEFLCKSSLALPIFVGMSLSAADYVCESIKNFYRSK
ncbi:MAG TPA: DegT/DnrJ/EryC1/StrS family aminotransferase [Spirochaetota bacterium]|nr:DegT/DnrJ/EryC1/StrS family aminotransferase [Spirochaetota bacterium]